MMPALITVTLAAVLRSLWIRRSTWRSPWEAGLSLSVALQGAAVVLMSPWAAGILGPPLRLVFRLWNVQHLLAHLCLVVAAASIVHHGLTRLADEPLLTKIFDRRVTMPLNLGVPLLVAMFVLADESYHPDLFPAHVSTVWLGAYWLVLDGLLIYLLGYAGRVMAVLRQDPRSKATANAYLAGAMLGAAAGAIQVSTAWAGVDVSLPVWLCACLGAIGFAHGSARSWQARVDWFNPRRVPPPQAIPPQAMPPQPAA